MAASLLLESPTVLRFPPEVVGSRAWKALQDACEYRDLRHVHEWRRLAKYQYDDERARRHAEEQNQLYHPHWYVAKHGRAALDAEVASELAASQGTVLHEDERGWWTYGGLAHRASEVLGLPVVRSWVVPPREGAGNRLWQPPPYAARPYQDGARDALIAETHAAVELPTGSGKSYVIADVFRYLGLPGVVLAPTKSIALQLVEDLRARFGTKQVGAFFDSKRQVHGYRFVVAISNSVYRLSPDDPIWADLAGRSVVIGDESHLLPADTLAVMMLGVFAHVPYRFFVSGTQSRSDGLGLVLEGLTGPVVYRKTLRELVDAGYLARPRFTQFGFTAHDGWNTSDAIALTRHHVYGHPGIYAHAGSLINQAAARGRRPLVLLDEVSQFPRLLPYLQHAARFAHGGVTKVEAKNHGLPEAYRKSNPTELVRAFDRGEFPILVGTGCIGIGTDVRTPRMVVDLVGGVAAEALRQRIGRGTRLAEGKDAFDYVDYVVRTVPKLAEHGEKRSKIYAELYQAPRYVEIS